MSNFFNKVKSSIDKGVNTVGANSKAMMEKTKVKGNITNLENERKHYIQYLGQVIFDMHTETGAINISDIVQNTIAEINKRVEMIQQQNEELARIDAELAAATGAGAQPAAPQQPFTPQPFNPQPIPPQQAQMPQEPVIPAAPVASTCTCGHANSAGAKFCAGCGSAVAPQ